MPDRTIIAGYDSDAGQWVASFDDAPHIACGGGFPLQAIRRLLEETEARSATFVLLCDRHLSGSGDLRHKIVWDPPKLLFPCGGCAGHGGYVGLFECEVCQKCRGRKFINV